jgi:hypothetical protein
MTTVTLDHNCIIHLSNGTNVGERVRAIATDLAYQCFVVNIGASEMLEKGVRPTDYATFEHLLEQAGIAHLPRLNPIGIFDITFYGHSEFAGPKDVTLLSSIHEALFGPFDKNANLDPKKALNRTCDVHTMRCHIANGNDIFLTADGNFSKATKLPRLLALGAKRICHPDEL